MRCGVEGMLRTREIGFMVRNWKMNRVYVGGMMTVITLCSAEQCGREKVHFRSQS